jgi:uncharacterized protein
MMGGEEDSMKSPPALLSIHDVMPETLPRISAILGLLKEAQVPPPTLLVVPGRGWDGEGLARLRGWVRGGHALAGHGWEHRALPPATLHHRIHAWLISRDQAEHLSRSRAELLERVRRTFRWFQEMDFPAPELYVPPAWAMGTLGRDDLRALPFRFYEVLQGLLDGHTGRLKLLPLAGFEADTRLRRLGLRLFNGLNRAGARATRRPLRISIHPFDLEYLLAADLRKIVLEPWTFMSEEEALGGPRRRSSHFCR